MATRFYFGGATENQVEVVPSSWSAGWDSTPSVVDQNLTRTPSDQTSAGSTKSGAGVGAPGDFVSIRRFISPPLYGNQTISGTLKGQMRCSESATTDDYTLAVAAKVIQSDGTDRGVLLAVSASDDASTTPPEMATALTNRAFRDSAESASLSLSSVDAQTDDRIVVEVGFLQNSVGGNCFISVGNNPTAGDLPEDDTTTTASNPWVEFSQDLVMFGYFGSTSTPTDGGTNAVDPTAVTPQSGMRAGDLVCMVGHQRAATATLAVSETGGQNWNSEAAIGTTNITVRLFWCVFNGAWTADPSVDFSAATCNSVTMHVFRAPATDWSWKVNVAQADVDDTTSPFTITGQTTVGSKPTVTFVGWFTADDNTWSGAGSGWTASGYVQYRNTAGSDQSNAYSCKHQFAAAATGNPSRSQASLGPDTTTLFIITFEADDPIPELVMPPMLPPVQFQ